MSIFRLYNQTIVCYNVSEKYGLVSIGRKNNGKGIEKMECRKRDEMRVAMPDYGKAPTELIEKHKRLTEQMAKLYEAGASLSSEAMLSLAREVNEVNRQIAEYYPDNQK